MQRIILHALPCFIWLMTSSLASRQALRWIQIRNEAGFRNITVDYISYNTKCFWWLNDELVVDGDRNIGVHTQWTWYKRYSIEGRWTDSYDIEDVMRTSLSIPLNLNVFTLRVQFVKDFIDTSLYINVPPPTQETILEYIPKFEFQKYPKFPKNLLAFQGNNDAILRFLFTAQNLDKLDWEEMAAEFINMDNTTQPMLHVKTSDMGDGFPELSAPSWSSRNKSSIEIRYLNSPSAKLRRIHVPFGDPDDRQRGMLKVTAGYRSRSCRLFAGVKITKSVFVNPPPHIFRVYFPESKVAFVSPGNQYRVGCGDDLDLSIIAYGGKLHWNDVRGSNDMEYPNIWLERQNRNVTPVAVIKRAFQTQTIYRIKNVSHGDTGTYRAFANIDGGEAAMDIDIYCSK